MDETGFDVALEHYPEQLEKNGEDMREIRVDGGDSREIRIDVDDLDNIEDQINIELNEGDRVTPGPIMSELQYEVDDNTTIDDEDLTSGSGSGYVMIDDATGMYMSTRENGSSGKYMYMATIFLG